MRDGIEVGGIGERPHRYTWQASGGVEIGGSAVDPFRMSYVPSGGVEIGGSAVDPFRLSYRASGGVEIGGNGLAPRMSYHMRGGVEIGPSGDTAGIRHPACELTMPRTLYARIDNGNEPVAPCPCWVFSFARVRLDYSDADQHWRGVGIHGLCGKTMRYDYYWIGPEEWRWTCHNIAWDDSEYDWFSIEGQFFCNPVLFAPTPIDMPTSVAGCVDGIETFSHSLTIEEF